MTTTRTTASARLRLIAAVGACCAGVTANASSAADARSPQADAADLAAATALLERLEAAEQRIRVLERRLELQTEDAERVAAEAPQIRANARGFSLASRDGAHSLRLRAVLNVDGRSYAGSPPAFASETWLLRQARVIVEGTLGGLFEYRLMPDFAGGRTVLQDAYVTARFRPAFAVTAGKFKVPFGIERLQSDNDIRFIERGLPNNLVPNRDIGLQVSGELLDGRLQYAVAGENGVVDGGSSDALGDVDVDRTQEYTARVFTQPFLQSDVFALRGFGVGFAVGYADPEGAAGRTLLPTYRSNGQLPVYSYRAGAAPTVADGERLRLSPQFHWYDGSFGLLGEYVRVEQRVARTVAPAAVRRAALTHGAWQVQASWLLTGEDAGYRAPVPRNAFARSAGWGAVELVARYGVLDLDAASFAGGAQSFADPSVSIRRARAVALGANWYLSGNVKTVLNYEWTQFDGGAPAGDRPDEKALFTRFQVGF
jgi:phosphate-selective porin OprO/OprP